MSVQREEQEQILTFLNEINSHSMDSVIVRMSPSDGTGSPLGLAPGSHRCVYEYMFFIKPHADVC